MNPTTPRTYRIGHNGLDWWAGTTPDGGQALVIEVGPGESHAYRFDRDGALLRVDVQPAGAGETFARLGLVPGPVVVRQFAQGHLLIRDRPRVYERFLADPSSVVPSEAEHLRAAVAEWDAEGRYVLIWGKEYWMERDGDIYAT